MRISEFLLPMLELPPEKRANAGGMAAHEWLSDTPGMKGVDLGHRESAIAQSTQHQFQPS
jgi:serine/threonine-protein kinase SRPK3